MQVLGSTPGLWNESSRGAWALHFQQPAIYTACLRTALWHCKLSHVGASPSRCGTGTGGTSRPFLVKEKVLVPSSELARGHPSPRDVHLLPHPLHLQGQVFSIPLSLEGPATAPHSGLQPLTWSKSPLWLPSLPSCRAGPSWFSCL